MTKQDIENKKVAGLAKLDEIEATYENDTYTPTITVKNKSSVTTGEGDEVDYSANIIYDVNNINGFDYLGESLKALSQQEIIDQVVNRVKEDSANIVLLDFRLHKKVDAD